MTGKEYRLVDAGARAKLLGELEPPDVDRPPREICIQVTANGISKTFFWKGPLLVSSSPVWLHGFKGTKTPSDRMKALLLVVGVRSRAFSSQMSVGGSETD